MFETISENITQGRLYELAGRTDDVCTIDFIEGSDSYVEYGSQITVVFLYTQEERRTLEIDITSLDGNPKIKAKGLMLADEKSDEITEKLRTDGIIVKDISSIMVLRSTPVNNTYGSPEKRSLKILEIPFKAYGGGRDIGWIYGFMCRRKAEGVEFMPDDEDLYTAYRFILDNDSMSDDEKHKVFDKDGHIVMSNVGYHYLRWRKEAGLLKEKDKELLRKLKKIKIQERFEILKDELRRSGISFNLFRGRYKDQALFFLQKLFTFQDKDFNILGKHPLYMDYRSFVHIYMHHVEDVNMGNQLAQKDKFQLYEKDVMYMITHIMHELNTDYQKFRENNPDKKYRRTGDKAFYCQGDYYEVFVDKDGRIESFYKASRNKN